MFQRILTELRHHIPFTIFGAVTGIVAVLVVLMAGFVVSTAFFILADQQSENYRRALYVHQIGLADKYCLDNNIGRVRDLLRAVPAIYAHGNGIICGAYQTRRK